MTFYVQNVLIVAAPALKKIKLSLSALIVAWGSIRRQVGIRVVNNYKKVAEAHLNNIDRKLDQIRSDLP